MLLPPARRRGETPRISVLLDISAVKYSLGNTFYSLPNYESRSLNIEKLVPLNNFEQGKTLMCRAHT
jgi:hypothetical protein